MLDIQDSLLNIDWSIGWTEEILINKLGQNASHSNSTELLILNNPSRRGLKLRILIRTVK